MNTATAPDSVMEAIGAAVTLGRSGNTALARERLTALWIDIGPHGDPFQQCALAHYLADLHTAPAEALVWDVRALDAAEKITDERAQRHHSTLRIAGFYPSLHLNLADNFRRLGSFTAAARHIDAARKSSCALAEDEYGTMIRRATAEVAVAIAARDTRRRDTAPGPDDHSS